MDKVNFNDLTFEETIQYCLGLEQEAVALYETLAAEANDDSARAFFTALAEMERGHVQSLKEMDVERFLQTVPREVPDLKTTDYMEPIDPGKQLTSRKALILAAQREKAAREMYEHLAQRYADEPLLAHFFTMMAEEEASHKHGLESEYERRVQGEF